MLAIHLPLKQPGTRHTEEESHLRPPRSSAEERVKPAGRTLRLADAFLICIVWHDKEGGANSTCAAWSSIPWFLLHSHDFHLAVRRGNVNLALEIRTLLARQLHLHVSWNKARKKDWGRQGVTFNEKDKSGSQQLLSTQAATTRTSKRKSIKMISWIDSDNG